MKVVGCVVALLLSGCIVYQMDKTPPCEGLSDAAKAECKFKPKCLLKCEMKVPVPRHSVWGKEMPQWTVYGDWTASALVARQREITSSLIEESELFAECREDLDQIPAEDEIRIQFNSECEYNQHEDGSGQTAVVFSLGLYPAVCFERTFRYAVIVNNGLGLTRKYRFAEIIRDRRGLLCACALVAGCESSSYENTFVALNRKVMNNLFVKMQQDGFFSSEGRDKAAAAKADAAETLKKNAAARHKELEDLKKAGIITEAEFAAEVKKLEGAGK